MESIQTKIIEKLKANFSRKQGLILGKGGGFLVAFFVVFLAFFLNVSSVQAAAEMDVSMFVIDKEENKPLEGDHEVTFTIYVEDSETQVWQESQEVEINYGLIKTVLGEINALPIDLDPLNNNYVLGIQIDDDVELSPRKRITPNQFAITAINALSAASLDGAEVGENSGDIVVLGNGGEIDEKFLPGDISYLGDEIDISDSTNLSVSGDLLELVGDVLSVKQGILTDGRICTYDATDGLVCNTDPATLGHDLVTLSGSYDYITLSGQDIIRGQIDLTTDVTGILPVANGGTTLGNSIDGSEITLGSDARGDIMYFNGTDWARLPAGTSGYYLQTQGAGLDPQWATATAGTSDWTQTGGTPQLTYLTDASSDFVVGGTSLSTAVFGLDVDAGTAQIGSDGLDGKLILHSEQGVTDYQTLFQPATQTQDIIYTLPADDGDSDEVLVTNGSGVLSWQDVTAVGGAGDITSVGDVSSGAAFTASGTQGTSLYFYDAQGRGELTIANLTAARTYTLPDATGTIALDSDLHDPVTLAGSLDYLI